MAKIVLDNIQGGFNLSKINDNFDRIEEALNLDVLYRRNPEGEPNFLQGDLDLNGFRIINANDILLNEYGTFSQAVELTFAARDDAQEAASNASASELASAASAAVSTAQANRAEGEADRAEFEANRAEDEAFRLINFEWQGEWLPSTTYLVNNIVRFEGNTYICIENHTSTGLFESEFWEIFAREGAPGPGSGDMLAANNLSELTDLPLARFNLGLGNVNNVSAANLRDRTTHTGEQAISTVTGLQTALDLRVVKTSDIGAAALPTGATADRPSGVQGHFRFNTTLNQFEGFNGSAWGSVGGGATGAPGNAVFHENDQNVTADYTITSGKHAMSAGPIEINSGVTVTVPAGSVWSIV